MRTSLFLLVVTAGLVLAAFAPAVSGASCGCTVPQGPTIWDNHNWAPSITSLPTSLDTSINTTQSNYLQYLNQSGGKMGSSLTFKVSNPGSKQLTLKSAGFSKLKGNNLK